MLIVSEEVAFVTNSNSRLAAAALEGEEEEESQKVFN